MATVQVNQKPLDMAKMGFYDWLDIQLVYPDIQNVGPISFDVEDIDLYQHPEQQFGTIMRDHLFDHLQEKSLIPSCFGYNELRAVESMGANFFAYFFPRKVLFAWKSASQYRRNNHVRTIVPSLLLDRAENRLKFEWNNLDVFHTACLAPRHTNM